MKGILWKTDSERVGHRLNAWWCQDSKSDDSRVQASNHLTYSIAIVFVAVDKIIVSHLIYS